MLSGGDPGVWVERRCGGGGHHRCPCVIFWFVVLCLALVPLDFVFIVLGDGVSTIIPRDHILPGHAGDVVSRIWLFWSTRNLAERPCIGNKVLRCFSTCAAIEHTSLAVDISVPIS